MNFNLRVFYEWLRDAYDYFFELVLVNFFWFLLTLPILTAPAAAGGLYFATNHLAHQRSITWRTFFTGFREHFWLSIKWASFHLFVIIILIINYLFYSQFEGSWRHWVQGFVLGAMGIWLMLSTYTFPLLLEQTDTRIRTSLRNSLILYIKKPKISVSVTVTIFTLLFISTRYLLPAWILITTSFSAYLANRAVIFMVEDLEP